MLWDRVQAYFHRRAFRTTAFDRRTRLVVFGKMTLATAILLYTSVHLAEPRTHSIASTMFPTFRWLAVNLFKFGWLLALIAEYLAMIFDRSPHFGAEITTVFAAIFTFCGAIHAFGELSILTVRVAYERIIITAVRLTLLFSLMDWYIGCFVSFLPLHFRIRTSAHGQPTQFLHLIVWYQMDWCTVMAMNAPAQLPPNVFGVLPIELQLIDRAWPTMDEAPRWIVMKLSDHAAPAG